MKKWPNACFIVQSADGSESVTVYTTGEAFKDVLDTIVVPVVSTGPELGIEDRVGKGVDDKVVK